jgi:hypothetical protein
MNTRPSPAWIFRFLILATLLLGLGLRFAVPIATSHFGADHSAYPGRVHRFFDRHQELADGVIDIAKGLGEALFIAAILAAIVDPYAKFRLGKEVGSEIARETVGQHLPEELRQELERIQDIDLYQLNMVIDITLDKVDALPGFLKWQTAMHFEVKNAAWNKRRFEHRFSISDSAAERHDGKIIAAAFSIDGVKQYSLNESTAELEPMLTRKNGSIVFQHPNSQKIASTRLGSTHRYEYANTTEHMVPHSEIQVVQVILPTVCIDLTVRHPAGVAIHTSLQYIDGVEPKTPDGETLALASRWNAERAYLTNEHIWIMYELDDGTPNPVPVAENATAQTKPAAAK